MMSLPDLEIVTICKGRLDFLKQTLPAMIATGFPVVVVDYDCPQGTAAYVASTFPSVRVVKVENCDGFNHSRARNLGAAGGRSRYLMFLDSDINLGPDFSQQLAKMTLVEGTYYLNSIGSHNMNGQCVLARSKYELVGGYDELFSGWGFEDIDFYLRLDRAGLTKGMLPSGTMTALPHSDGLRNTYSAVKDKWHSYRQNSIYAQARNDAEALFGRTLTMDERRAVRATVEKAVADYEATDRPSTFEFSMTLNSGCSDGQSVVAGYTLRRQLTFTLTLVEAGAESWLSA